jgi:hypothetical protein
MSYQIYQTNGAPFGYVRPVTETVMVDDKHQHLNVAIPQAINYPSLTVHSMPLQTQPTAPALPSVPNPIQYRVMSPNRMFRKSNNKVEPSQNGEYDIKNNVSVNAISQREKNRKIIIATAILVFLVFLALLCIVVSTIAAVASKLRPVTGNLVNETFIYTEQEIVLCLNDKCGCIFQPCMNGGKCNPVGFNSFTCSCQTHYSGSYCQTCNI